MQSKFFLSILLVFGLLSPPLIYAQERDFLLSEKDTKVILNAIQREVSKIGGDLRIFKYNAEEQAVLTLLRNSSRETIIEFLPGFLVTETIKIALNLVSFLEKFSETTVKVILKEIEKQTVKKAVEIGTNWLFQNDIRVGSGNIKHKKTSSNFQYLITYSSMGSGKADIVFEFYSTDPIIPIPFTSSIGTFAGSLGESSYARAIDPFIIHVETVIKRYSLGWRISSSAKTKITVEFPDKVPRLELAKELPYPIEEQKINLLNKLTAVKRVFDTLGNAGIEVFNTLGKGVGIVKDTIEVFFSFISKIISFGGAGLINPLQEESLGLDVVESQLNEIKDDPKLEVELNPIKDENEKQAELDLVEDEEKLNLAREICVIDPLATPTLGGIIFSEIAWMGTAVSATDEWIRLQNVSHLQNLSNASVNLQGWQLIDKDGDIEVIFDKDYLIPPRGVFLLERTDDTSNPDIPADLIYTGSLRNSNEALYLFDSNCVLRDKVVADPDWPAGESSSQKSMARKADFTWQTSSSSNGISDTEDNLDSIEIQQYSENEEGFGVKEEQEMEITICSQENLETPGHTPVILNEIAWMGTTNSANDEWIELKNITNNQVLLENWQLIDKDNQIKVIFTNQDTILANGFYILERTDDTTLSTIVADNIYTGGLSNIDESLRLFNASCVLIDEVIASPDWPAGDNETKRTMERKGGSDPPLVWQTYYGDNNGTPKAENSIAPVSSPSPSPSPGSSPSPSPSPTPSSSPSPSPTPTPTPSPLSPETMTKTIVINEIAWMGTVASANDEWIELYNTTSEEIDMTGWKLQAEDGTPSITLSGSIGAAGYFLLERTDDTTISDITADFIYTGALGNTGEVLRLYDASDVLVDKVDDSSSWSAGDNTIKQSMERIDTLVSGTDSTNWVNNNLITHNGEDLNGAFVNGTPGQINSVSVSSTTISSLRLNEFDSITLAKLGSPYSSVSLSVPSNKTLIIEPGVRVEFKNNEGRFVINGTLRAIGTSENGIIFTSDNSSNWCGLNFTSTSINSELNYTTIEKSSSGGAGCTGNQYSVWVEGSSITFQNSTITSSGNSNRKLHLENSDSVIDNVTISGAAAASSSAAIYIENGSPTIQNSTIQDSSIGIWSDGGLSTPTIQNNTFTGNTHAVKLSSSGAVLSLNTATNNTYNGIFVEGQVFFTDITWKADSMPYIINQFTVNEGKTLTIEAGAQIQFIGVPYSGPELVVKGTLVTQGTLGNLVTFTKSSSIAFWKRIHFTSTSSGSSLSYTQINYAGSALGKMGALYIEGSVDLQNVTIQNSPSAGIYASGTVTGDNITLQDNTYAFRLDVAECPSLTNVTISGSGDDFYAGSLECVF